MSEGAKKLWGEIALATEGSDATSKIDAAVAPAEATGRKLAIQVIEYFIGNGVPPSQGELIEMARAHLKALETWRTGR